jgi:hypothetical protein
LGAGWGSPSRSFGRARASGGILSDLLLVVTDTHDS